MVEEGCGPPSWFFRTGTRSPGDDGYFENMIRVVFQAGLSWRLIERKWPNFKKAFEGFSVSRVAGFDDDDAERLMADKGIIRNRRKIVATIHNAKQFQTIKREFGSFQAYLDTLDKSNNYALVIKELSKKFKHLGPSSVRIFLYSVGEDIKHISEG